MKTLDRTYVAASLRGYRRARKAGVKVPAWFYTHAWRELAEHKKYFERLGIACYASVHSEQEASAAVGLGYKLAIDPGEPLKVKGKVEPKSGFREIFGVRALNCPEQVKGAELVTCDKCMYCPLGKGNVVFYRH